VDRLWPRGLQKGDAALDAWMKDVAPTPDLRKWFGHDPARFNEFAKRYRLELSQNPAVDALAALAGKGPVTLIYAARDETHNHARVLAEFMNERKGGRQ